MPRRARSVLPGYVYHVTQRGNHQQDVFNEDQDRALYLKYIQEYSQKYAMKVYAYSLMNNHVHFIVSPGRKDSLARTFQITHQRYAYYFQRKTIQEGHLWQGRFFSGLILGRHLQEAVRYVEKNPVRAGLVGLAWQYAWSSARAHMGKTYKIIELAEIKEIMDVPSWEDYLMGEERTRFIELIRKCTFKERVLGPKGYVKELEERFNVKLLPEKMGRPRLTEK